MPEIKAFIKGFDLTRGHEYDGAKIIDVEGHEKVLSLYHKYEYYITVTLKKVAPHVNIRFPQLQKEVGHQRIVYSQYGNPYICWIRQINVDEIEGTYQIRLIGLSQRVYKKDGYPSRHR